MVVWVLYKGGIKGWHSSWKEVVEGTHLSGTFHNTEKMSKVYN